MTGNFVRIATALALAVLTAWPAAATGIGTPRGAVVLTVAGKIANGNRPAFDPKRDGFLAYHERSFGRAAEFDRAMLEALGTKEIRIDYAGWAEPVTFSGPRLADVLEAVGWKGMKIVTLALDGFATEIGRADLDAHDWVLATRGNGTPFGIGARGPLWLVYDPPGDGPATEADEGKWPWALFYIQAE